MTRSFRLAALSASAALSSFVASTAEAAADCWRADEIEAVQFHEFKLMMNVAALNCQSRNPAAADSYNDFISAKRDYIISSQSVVRAHYIRNSGVVVGARDYANTETLSGNRYSAMDFNRAQCDNMAAYSRIAANTPDGALPQLVRAFGIVADPSACPVDAVAAVAEAKVTPAVVQPIAINAPSTTDYETSAPPPAPATVAEPAMEEVAAGADLTPVPADAPVAAAAVPASGAAPSDTAQPPSAAAALAEAARALAAAAAALNQSSPK